MPYNTAISIKQFVSSRLKYLGLKPIQKGGVLQVHIDTRFAQALAVPSEGNYLLKFDPSPISSEIVGYGQPIHVTLQHPMIDFLSQNLTSLPIQLAEYSHENAPTVEVLDEWMTRYMEKLGLQKESIETRETGKIIGLEVWFEAVTKSGQGMFPVILKRQLGDGKNPWVWDPHFQRLHGKRRGELCLRNDIRGSIPDKNELRKAVEVAGKALKQNLANHDFIDGAFLRRLRQLRQEQVQLRIAEIDDESEEIIQRHKRRIKNYKKEVKTQINIRPITVVMLYGNTNVLLVASSINKDLGSRFDLSMYWAFTSPDIASIRYHMLDHTERFDLENGYPISPPADLDQCPTCKEIVFSEDILPYDFGTGHGCSACRETNSCSICERSIDPGLVKKEQFREDPSVLCPDHVRVCDTSGLIAHPDDLVETQDGLHCHSSFVNRCHICLELELNPYWRKEDLTTHSSHSDIYLCKEHTKVCTQTGRVLFPKEVVELESKKLVGLDLTEICVECAIKEKEYSHHLRNDMNLYSRSTKTDPKYLCAEHAFKCSETERILREEDVVELQSGKLVDRKITYPCLECQAKKEDYVFHLKKDVSPYGLNYTKHLCARHAVICEISGVALRKSDTVVINSQQRVSKKLAEICERCKEEGVKHYHHLRRHMTVVFYADQTYYACTDHSFDCWACNSLKPLLHSYFKFGKQKRICGSCFEEWRITDTSSKPCFICSGIMWDSSKKGTDTCPACKSKTLPKSMSYTDDSIWNGAVIEDRNYRIYLGSRDSIKFKLIVRGKILQSDEWWLVDDSDQGLATNRNSNLIHLIHE